MSMKKDQSLRLEESLLNPADKHKKEQELLQLQTKVHDHIINGTKHINELTLIQFKNYLKEIVRLNLSQQFLMQTKRQLKKKQRRQTLNNTQLERNYLHIFTILLTSIAAIGLSVYKSTELILPFNDSFGKWLLFGVNLLLHAFQYIYIFKQVYQYRNGGYTNIDPFRVDIFNCNQSKSTNIYNQKKPQLNKNPIKFQQIIKKLNKKSDVILEKLQVCELKSYLFALILYQPQETEYIQLIRYLIQQKEDQTDFSQIIQMFWDIRYIVMFLFSASVFLITFVCYIIYTHIVLQWIFVLYILGIVLVLLGFVFLIFKLKKRLPRQLDLRIKQQLIIQNQAKTVDQPEKVEHIPAIETKNQQKGPNQKVTIELEQQIIHPSIQPQALKQDLIKVERNS